MTTQKKTRSRSLSRTLTGVIAWVGIVAAIGISIQALWTSESRDSIDQLMEYSSAARTQVEISLPEEKEVRLGDPIFVFRDGQAIQVGEIARVGSRDSNETEPLETDYALATFYSNAPPLDDATFLTYHATPDNIGWVVQTMLPSEMRSRIGELIAQTYVDHHREIVDELRPVIRQGLADAALVVRQDLETSFDNHQDELKKIAERYQSDLVEEKIYPLIRKEIWPIVQRHGAPIAQEIGEEVWGKVSIWRFGLRIAYDVSPLPKRDLTKKEFAKFVENEVVPIIDDHLPDIFDVQKDIISDIAENDEVKSVLGEAAREVLQDMELREVITQMLREVFVDNPRLNRIIRERWSSVEAQRAMRITQERLEPTITTIGEELFGNPHRSITPEFNRVLRNKVLLRDVRWFVLHRSNESQKAKSKVEQLAVRDSNFESPNPFYEPARK